MITQHWPPCHRGGGEAWMASSLCLVHPQHPRFLHNGSSAHFPLIALVCCLCGTGGHPQYWKLGPSTLGGPQHLLLLCAVWIVPSLGGDRSPCHQCHLSKPQRQPVRKFSVPLFICFYIGLCQLMIVYGR